MLTHSISVMKESRRGEGGGERKVNAQYPPTLLTISLSKIKEKVTKKKRRKEGKKGGRI